jgi:hypothetical protein
MLLTAFNVLEKYVMGGACSVVGGGEIHVQGFDGETCGNETTGESQV